jgi:hypothetical protein
LATKFTYKMRSGGKGMWGRGPALCKHNYLKKKRSSSHSKKKKPSHGFYVLIAEKPPTIYVLFVTLLGAPI